MDSENWLDSNFITDFLCRIEPKKMFPEVLVSFGQKFVTNLYLIFRGTQLGNLESIKKDLLTDLKFKQRQAAYLTDESRVHTGFDAGYMSVRWVQV